MKMFKSSNISKKLIIIVVLLFLFLIPLKFISNLIYDRENYQSDAVYSIVEPLGGEAKVDGVFIAVPCKEYDEKTDANGKVIKNEKNNYIIFTPEKYNLNIKVDTHYLKRGIFKVPVYSANMEFDTTFANFDFSNYGTSVHDINENEAVLLIGISDKKSITAIPRIRINNADIEVSNIVYDSSDTFPNKLCYMLKGINLNEKLELKGEIDLQGGNSISITPIASNNKINMVSNWKSPGFSGGFLPKEREIDKDGFNAMWEVSGLNINYPRSFIYGVKYRPEIFTIDLIQHIDNYALAVRSIKYAFLFLCIPFLTIFVLEIILKRKIHPIQYILIGAVDIIFYLLLMAISEHIHFGIAYLIGCLLVMITSFMYVISIFKSYKCGCILSGIQLLSYIFLYVTLQSEDYALLIGSIGLFVVIVSFMFVTRKIDWYNPDQNLPDEAKCVV